MRMWVQSLASLSELRSDSRSQKQLGSCITVTVAVAVASSCSSKQTLSLGTSICHRYSPKKKKKKEKEKRTFSAMQLARAKNNEYTQPNENMAVCNSGSGIEFPPATESMVNRYHIMTVKYKIIQY